MLEKMTKRERVKAALAGKPVDRVPVALWKHWPIDDQNAESLAQCTLDFQRRYDFDFIKIPPSHTYCIDDYGARTVWDGRTIGDRSHVERVIKRIEDWDCIKPVDVHKGMYGEQLRCLRIVLEERDPGTPVIHTIFNPLNMARFLAGDEAYLVHLRRDPARVERALSALTETCANFAQAVIREGADGIFLSTAAANYAVMSEEEYRRFGRPYDLAVLEAAADGWFNVLHICRQHPMFTQFTDYPIQAVNWHDRTAGPSLSEAAQLFSGALIGGIEQHVVLNYGTPAAVQAQIRDAIRQMEGCRLIVAAGCTFPVTVPEGNLLVARQAVETTAVR